MQFLTALVEHFIVGIISLIWLIPLLDGLQMVPAVDLEKHKEVLIAIGLPSAYVVGIFVDVFASVLTTSMRWGLEKLFTCSRVKAFFGGRIDGKDSKPYQKTVKILRRSPDEAVKFLQLLTSREKTCRGVFLCFMLGALINAVFVTNKYFVSPRLLLALAALFFIVWLRLTVLTEVFKDQLSVDDQ